MSAAHGPQDGRELNEFARPSRRLFDAPADAADAPRPAPAAVTAATSTPPQPVVLRTPPNRTSACFFLVLGALHAAMAAPALWTGHPQGYVGAGFAGLFCFVALIAWKTGSEMAVLAGERRVCLRTGVGRLAVQRSVAFEQVREVRLTLGGPDRVAPSRIELVCDGRYLACPPTRIPRQQALYLAITLGVPLLKIVEGDEAVKSAALGRAP
jgi:hypothetical protein